MKKKNLIKQLQLKKTQISSLEKQQLQGGTIFSFRFRCEPIDLSQLETCTPECGLTDTCTQFNGCNDITFNNCTVYNCGTGGGGTGNQSGDISCPGYVC